MNEPTARKRPAWVWIISIFYIISAVWTLFSFFLIFSGALPLPPQQAAYFRSLTSIDYFSASLLAASR